MKQQRMVLVSMVISFSSLLFVGSLSAAQRCFEKKIPSERELNFRACIETPDQEPHSPMVIYFLHGHGGSEKDWGKSKFRQKIYRHWKRDGIKAMPAIITFSLGKKTNLARRDILDSVFDELMPYLESQVGFELEERVLAGMSLGGWNALALLLEKESYFDRVALLCPAISRVHSWSPESEIRAYIRRTKANPFLVRYALHEMKRFYGSLEHYQTFNPYQLAPVRLSTTTPSLYLSANQDDIFGFWEGAQDLAQFASSHGTNLQWHLRPGDHCTLNTKDISRFLIPHAEE